MISKTGNGNRISWKTRAVAMALCVVLIGSMLLLSGCSGPIIKTPVDINPHVVVTTDGYDGYGTVSFKIDYDEIVNSSSASAENKIAAMEVLNNFELFQTTCDATDLKNGDIITVSWTANEEAVKAVQNYLGVKFEHEDYSCTISGLTELRDYDPFVNLIVDTHGTASGVGSVDMYIYPEVDADIKWQVAHDGNNGSLKNGDILNIKIVDDLDLDAFAKETGLRITRTEQEYELHCLSKYVRDGDIFNYIYGDASSKFDQIIKDWVVSGLNDSAVSANERTFELHGYLYYTNAEYTEEVHPSPDGSLNPDQADEPENTDDALDVESYEEELTEPTEGMLFAIYNVIDPFAPAGYYVFIGLEGVFSHDQESLYYNHGERVPDSFIYYEKETIRYSVTFGWRQGSEEMGFLHNGIAFAGHEDVQDTYAFIEKYYGKDYEHRYVYPGIRNEISDRHGFVIEEEVEE